MMEIMDDLPHLLPLRVDGPRAPFVRGEGVELIDAGGRRYLDAASGVGVTCLGYSARDVVDAMTRQAATLPFVHALRFTTPVVEALAARVAALAPVEHGAVFFTSGGSEAVESAIKLAAQYWSVRGAPGKWKVIGRQPSYHGNTLAALSAGGHAGRRRRYAPLLPPFPHVPAPNPYRGCRLCDGRCTLACADALERTIESEGADTVAAFIAEPVVGAAGGALVPPPGYFQRVRAICDRHDVLLIADEVLTGWGRLGTVFGLERFGITADIVTFGKGIAAGYVPLGGLVAGAAIRSALRAAGTPFEHSFTMSAHPVACAAGLATVRRLLDGGLIERVAEREDRFLRLLREAADGVTLVGDVRGMGYLAGIELVRDRSGREPFPTDARIAARAADAALQEGLLVYACTGGAGTDGSAGDTLLVMPPFVTSNAELEAMAGRLRRALCAVSPAA